MRKKLVTMMTLFMVVCLGMAGCNFVEPPTDTVKWINTTYAVLTASNNANLRLIGGYKKNDSTKELVLGLLKDSWEVTDRKSADETLEWLLSAGQRTQYIDLMNQIKDSGVLTASKEDLQKTLGENANYTINMVEGYKKNGEKAIDAWDYCRAIQLLGFYYVADFYTEQEAMDKSLEIAKTLQQSYSSWEEMVDSYMCGYQFWQEDDASDEQSATYQRRQVYEKLKNSKENPYTIDWNLELTKTW